MGLLWLAFGPTTPDLAAQVFRARLFAAHGFVLYDPQWYGGHLLPAYSFLFPPLGALVGVRTAGALATGVAIVLFDRLLRPELGDRAWMATSWFAVTAGMNLLSARLTFALGLAVGLGALLAARRGRNVVAACLSAATPLASPLAGLFLALCGLAWMICERRRAPAVVLAGATASLAAMELAFREGGSFGFSVDQLVRLMVVVALIRALVPRSHRVIRCGMLVYAVVALAVFFVPGPLGDNYTRLALLFAGPVLVALGSSRRAWWMVALAPLLLVWSWHHSAQDLRAAATSTARSHYYAPLVSYLGRHDPGALRIEIPFTRGHWEAVYVGARFMLARGWERQLDQSSNALFYRDTDAPLSPNAYRRWLRDKGVRYVAVSDAPADFSARAEDALIGRHPSFLHPVWRSRHWRVFQVRGSDGLLRGPGRLVSVGPDEFTVDARRPGMFLVRLHFSPYWQLPDDSGCVQQGPHDWTRLRLVRAGQVEVSSKFSVGRIFSHDRRCA